jgi:hypothetical protein
MKATKTTTEKEVTDLKKIVARLEKKILLMQAEIKKKQDKKFTITIRRDAIHKHLKSFLLDPGSGLSKNIRN